MSQRSKDVRVGVAVIAAAVILILGIVWIGEFRMNRKWVGYTAYFAEAGGLSTGDPVTVAGLEMGKVGSMAFENGRVKVDMLLEPRATLRADCSVEIRSIGLMGEKFIYIVPGTAAEIVRPGATLDGKYKAGLTEMTIMMEDVFIEVKQLSQTLRRFIGVEEDTNTLSESLGRLNQLADEMLALIHENKDDLRSTARSLRTASDNLNDILGGRKQEILDGIDQLARASASLDSLSRSLRSVAESVEKGEGTLGLLVKEKTLHDQIETAVKNLDLLIKDIREHPERYIKVEIF
jgi:phospholipid/cholesterol/gamma-HCH transport system substrate-binding protein